VLDFYNGDYCPFAQRTWIALLEKESDIHNPKYFRNLFVSSNNKDREETSLV